jgi:hypothetical protein
VNAEQWVCSMQKLLRKLGGRIIFVSHRQTRNYLWSRDVIVPFQVNTTRSPLYSHSQNVTKKKKEKKECPVIRSLERRSSNLIE